MAYEALSRLLKFAANVAKVVDLAVVDDPVARLRIVHGLVRERRKI